LLRNSNHASTSRICTVQHVCVWWWCGGMTGSVVMFLSYFRLCSILPLMNTYFYLWWVKSIFFLPVWIKERWEHISTYRVGVDRRIGNTVEFDSIHTLSRTQLICSVVACFTSVMTKCIETSVYHVIKWIIPVLYRCDSSYHGVKFMTVFLFFHQSFVSFHSSHLFYLLTVGAEAVYFHLITLRHTPQSVGLLWTKDGPVAETSASQHTTLTRDKHPCHHWDSNQRSQQALGSGPTP
jgi:hypothetical protein